MSKALNENVTILIKSFLRPQCIDMLVKSIRAKYPVIKIVIVDDSDKNYNLKFDENVDVYFLPFNSGSSAGRNYGVEQIKTPFFFVCDDDSLFIDETDLDLLYDIISSSDLDILAGDVYEGKKKIDYVGSLERVNDELHFIRGKNNGVTENYTLYDIVLQAFMARTDSIKKYKWDKELKTGEHTAFFFDNKDDIKTGHTSKSSIAGQKRMFYKEYSNFRGRALEYFNLWLKKSNLKTRKAFNAKMNHKVALQNLIDLDSVFRETNSEYWLSCGTLLGLHRERDFIHHDEDTDVCVNIESLNKTLIDAIKAKGFTIHDVYGRLDDGFEIAVERQRVKTDLFFFYKKKDYWYFSVYSGFGNRFGLLKTDYVFSPFELKEREFKGHMFMTPDNIEKYITENYGENWRVPITRWNYVSSPSNAIRTKVRVLPKDSIEDFNSIKD